MERKDEKVFLGLFISFIIAGCATTSNPSSVKEKVSAIVTAGFPEGYQDWANTYSKTVLDKASPFYGFQRVLVNKIALPVYKNGKNFPYPEGSQLVLEFNEPTTEGPVGDVVKGMTNWLALMTKDSKAANTGGWIFEAYDGASKVKKIWMWSPVASTAIRQWNEMIISSPRSNNGCCIFL